MRYRFFDGQLKGQHRRVLVFEKDGQVFRYQMSRVAFNPLKVHRLEDVTPDILGFTGEVRTTPVSTTTESDPHKILAGACIR